LFTGHSSTSPSDIYAPKRTPPRKLEGTPTLNALSFNPEAQEHRGVDKLDSLLK